MRAWVIGVIGSGGEHFFPADVRRNILHMWILIMLSDGYTSDHVLKATTASETSPSARTNMIYPSSLGSL